MTSVAFKPSTQPYDLTDISYLLSCPPSRYVTTYPPTPLRVLHRSKTDPYTFEVKPYVKNEPYYAISYTWPATGFNRLATSSEPCTIIPESGTPYQTVHLSRFAADASARLPDPFAPLWIDHECINQDPASPEKAAQVAAMDDIYNKAAGVLVLLEDTGLDTKTLHWLNDSRIVRVGKEADRQVEIVSKVLSARWFTRAWCSQEMALSSRAHIFVHNFSNHYEPLWLSPDKIEGWNGIARVRNPGARIVVQPQAHAVRGLTTPVGWAAGVVSNLGCWDPWDKVRLLLNLMRIPRDQRGLQLPTDAAGTDGTKLGIASLNVWRLINLWAIGRHDFSLLLGGHRTPLTAWDRQYGFMLWSGIGRHRDQVIDNWKPAVYEVSRQPRPVPISSSGLGSITLTGLARKVTVPAEEWLVWRDKNDTIWAKVGNGNAQEIPNILKDCDFAGEKSMLCIINLVSAFYHMKRKDLYTHMRCLEESWLYTLPFEQDMHEDIQRLFKHRASRRSQELAKVLADMKLGDQVHFYVVPIDDMYGTPPMIVYGNGAEELKPGRTIFQPWAIRPTECILERMACNMMVLDKKGLEWKCVGGLRCLGMLLDPADVPGQADEVALEIM